MIELGIALALLILSSGLLWWAFLNGLQTAPRIGRHARVRPVDHSPSVPTWLRDWLMRAFVVFLILVLMAGINYLSEWLFGLSIGDWVDDLLGRAGAKTLAKTLWQPLPMFIFAAGAIALAVLFKKKKLAIVIVLAVAGLTIFHYFVPTKCWSKDTACIAAEQKAADAKAAEEAQAAARKRLADEAAAAQRVHQARGGLMTAAGRLIIEYRPECARKVLDPYTFERTYAPFPGERCSTDFMYPAGACAMYKVSEDGPEQGPYGDCPGSKSPSIPADPKFARSIGAQFGVRLVIDQPVTVQTFR